MRMQNQRAEINPWVIYQRMEAEVIRHCENVGRYTHLLYESALREGLYPKALSTDKLLHIKQAVTYHDIGKSRIPSSVLNQLDPMQDERMELEPHVQYGLEIFQDVLPSYHVSKATSDFLDCVLESMLHHHERFDGTGYPRRLKGERISVLGRICALVDFYDTLRTPGPNRPELRHQCALLEIQKQSGKRFDPKLVDVFMKYQGLYERAGLS